MKSVAAMVLVAMIAAPAFADDSAPGNAGIQSNAAPVPQGESTSDTAYLDKIVCKVFPPPTGTRLGARKVCQTERQWREIQKQSQDRINNMQMKNGGYGGPSG